MENPKCSSPYPHVLMFPLPAQGDLSPMIHLAELLCLAHLKVTFINSTHNHKCLTTHSDIEARFSQYPEFEFKVIPDGLPEDHPRTGNNWLFPLLRGLKSNVEPFLRQVLLPISTHESPVTSLIVDSLLGFAFDVANEAGVPVIEFRGSSASNLWVLFCVPELVQAGEIPFKDEEMDELVQNVPGMTDFLRLRDLHTVCRAKDIASPDIQFTIKAQKTWKPQQLILNTFEDLEAPILSLIQEHCPKIYSLGPLHAHLSCKLNQKKANPKLSNSLWEEEKSCVSWLDEKPDKSVVYVSFGSLASITKDQFLEIWAGLLDSKKYFLWVVRPNMIVGSDPGRPTPDELLEGGTNERGLVVRWAPQEEVLSHRAVGGFLTHSGWNSTVESIVAGVPMLCWPYFADQHVNSRCVSEVWRIGLDMKDICDRVIVEKMIRDLMDEKREELEISMAEMSELAKKSVSEGGKSHCNLNRLIEDIKLMSKNSPH